jgi:hypothetical protein
MCLTTTSTILYYYLYFYTACRFANLWALRYCPATSCCCKASARFSVQATKCLLRAVLRNLPGPPADKQSNEIPLATLKHLFEEKETWFPCETLPSCDSLGDSVVLDQHGLVPIYSEAISHMPKPSKSFFGLLSTSVYQGQDWPAHWVDTSPLEAFWKTEARTSRTSSGRPSP